MQKIRIGIFFGGPSREREISFAGGRTVYDNLNKAVFEPVPIFIDSLRNLILLDWHYLYKGTIRDFYPPVEALPPSNFQVYLESLGDLSPQTLEEIARKVGQPIAYHDLADRIDFAFLALHGEYGEDGQLQGLLESYGIPYSGSGIPACAIGMDKALQKKLLAGHGFGDSLVRILDRSDWVKAETDRLFEQVKQELGLPFVIRPANQGSSIGVTILGENASREDFRSAVDKAFFRLRLHRELWNSLSPELKREKVRTMTDIREGLGFPVFAGEKVFYHPEQLLEYLNNDWTAGVRELTLESGLSEQRVVLESFIEGKEFSCIVVRDTSGHPVALPPTEIIKKSDVFDYRSKYLPGLSRKITPIQLEEAAIERIREKCADLFSFLEFNTYARIDGFYSSGQKGQEGTVFLNDPNTTSGMLPSSFFFHQAAEIGLNPSQFLSFIIRTSIWERIRTDKTTRPAWSQLLQQLDQALHGLRETGKERKKIGVIMGGYSFERHISVESGRNIFEKLASSQKYEPIPIFLLGNDTGHRLYRIPINLLLKDNADDIRDKILNWSAHPLIDRIKTECREITKKYASSDMVFEPVEIRYPDLPDLVDGVFIALHGRPGEDGGVQTELEKLGLPYNGSDAASSGITIDKFETLRILRENGFPTASQLVITRAAFLENDEGLLDRISQSFDFPLIAKPVDDGCSSAVMKIRDREMLHNYLKMLFRNDPSTEGKLRRELGLLPEDEFPIKDRALIESVIGPDGAKKFLEITGGLLTHYGPDGVVTYEVFEPSEALATGEVLSLEEKFLAGEGQNITPARLADNPSDYPYIARQVKASLEKAARVLGVKGYCRIDAFVRVFDDNRAETIIIELNSLPGMTPATCIYHQAALNGYKPFDFIDQILEFGFHEQGASNILE